MGFFRPKLTKEEKAKVKAITARGVRVRAEILAMAPTGLVREEVAHEHEFRLRFTGQDGVTHEVTTRQHMNHLTLTGLEPGAPVDISYDRDDPTTVLVHSSPNYRVIESRGGLVAVPIVDQG